jgi:hypothetical protein
MYNKQTQTKKKLQQNIEGDMNICYAKQSSLFPQGWFILESSVKIYILLECVGVVLS